jgi:hypothetical protein
MKQSERFDLIDRVARELQSRFKTYELDSYLKSFGLFTPADPGPISSKWVYSKGILSGVPIGTVLKIADDLGLDPGAIVAAASLPPKNWEGVASFHLFVSHISAHKDKAVRLRACLEPFGISAFVAHEDIHPTKEWEEEILRALRTMDAFLAMHTKGFSASTWTQQETGFAVCRGVKIISFRMGEDPTGFLARRQAMLRNQRGAEEIAAEIDRLLTDDPLTKDRLAEAKGITSRGLDDDFPF